MKKALTALLAVILAVSAGACSQAAPKTFELALITDSGSIDDKSFNEGSYEGVKQYAAEANLTYAYYKPTEISSDAYLAAIDLAVTGGAKVVVCPGYLFSNAVYLAQTKYPAVKFILIDTAPSNVSDTETMATVDGKAPVSGEAATASNTVSIIYKEEQPGFLAGYALVKAGYTRLGFMGGVAVPAVVRYGYGFLQGADYAAEEMGLTERVSVNYFYTGSFGDTPEAHTKAASWYANGVEAIFACGGNVGSSVMRAAESAQTKVIGVDVDQANLSNTVINSAMKGLTHSVYITIKSIYDGTFVGGLVLNLGAESDSVGLAMTSNRIEGFTQAEYDAVYDALKTDASGIASGIIKDVDADGKTVPYTGLKLRHVTVNYEN